MFAPREAQTMKTLRSRALYRLDGFEAELGAAYVAALPPDIPPGDAPDTPYVSGLELLEDGVRLGPAHALHAEIRAIGSGRFSHWGRVLYLSTSDNSDPRSNGREYSVFVPKNMITVSATGGLRSAALAEAIKESALEPESEAHAILCTRLLAIATSTDPQLRLGHVLEIGSYGHPGLAFLLLLLGAERVTLNNRKSVRNHLSTTYVENLLCLTANNPAAAKDWRRLLVQSGDGYGIRSELLGLAGDLDAGRVQLDEPVDFIFSFSVLEHIRNLPQVLKHLRTLLRPGGAMYHWVDVRDHTSFADPLAFLRLSCAEFATRYSEENNRWRPSDYLRMLEEAGFSKLEARFLTQNPLLGARSDVMWLILEDLNPHLAKSIEEIDPWVTEEVRVGLHQDFRSFSRNELSVTAFCVWSKRA
jgi:SAM-dependent methyltransferase